MFSNSRTEEYVIETNKHLFKDWYLNSEAKNLRISVYKILLVLFLF